MKVPHSDALIRATAEAVENDSNTPVVLLARSPAGYKADIVSDSTIDTCHDTLASCLAERKSSYVAGRNATGRRAIEDVSFPFEHLSAIAELESWRKEINRPVYHIHKWWAQRLGSVFRAILLGTFAPQDANVLKLFYQPTRLTGAVIFDPFMGSGTTIGEALKLGARAIGRDINPVAHFVVRNALRVHSRQEIVETFRAIEQDIAPAIRYFYRARLPEGGTAEVLYYFWVKVIPCPQCERSVDLFASHIFAQHAYPTRRPEAHALCPHCGAINTLRYDAEHACCSACRAAFSPKAGAASGAKATCPYCNHAFPIAKTVQKRGEPPAHRLYAKMVLRSDGSKDYLRADDYDLALYDEASVLLKQREDAYPIASIEPGYNTDQALNYCYTRWHQMFNDRQLLCLSLLAERIRMIPDESVRDLFTCLFSGALEFNNMLASFKGEGTGAVRHMFSHHILKPERTPLEANLWGTPKSSGAFSTLFESRLIRALDYCDTPFEIGVTHKNGTITSEKLYGLSCPLGHDAASTFAHFQEGRHLYLSCGDSAATDLDPESVDAVVTDPPFFDNVHYSQLADFFYAWQCYVLGRNGYHNAPSTRSSAEVQQSNPAIFTERLTGIWAECYRVLRSDGLLVFTYHHSRTEGWRCILESLVNAGFGIVAAHPIKAEMSVATPKRQAKEPIDLDIILVCRKREVARADLPHFETLIDDATREAAEQVIRLNVAGRRLSRNDVRIILSAQVIRRLSWQPSLTESVCYLNSCHVPIEAAIEHRHQRQQTAVLAAEPQECLETIANPRAGTSHIFTAYRVAGISGPQVTLAASL